jgi:hypothetical protein
MRLISARPEVRRQGEARTDQGCEDIRRAPDRDSAGPEGTYYLHPKISVSVLYLDFFLL